MSTDDPVERARELAELARDDPAAVDREAVASLLERESSAVRREAIRAFRSAEWPADALEDVLEPLGDALGSADPLVRNGALQALADVASRDPSLVEPFLGDVAARLADDQQLVVGDAIECLSIVAIERPDAVRPYAEDLLAVLEADVGGGVRSPVLALARIAREHPEPLVDAVDRFVDILLEEGEGSVSVGMREIDSYSDLDRLRDLSSSVTEGRRRRRVVAGTVVIAVARTEPDAVLPRLADLADLLEHPVPPIRTVAIDVLGVLARDRPERVAEYLPDLAATLEASPSVSGSATVALAALSQSRSEAVLDVIEPFAGALIDRLEADDAEVRSAAAGLLSYLGEESPGAVRPALPTVRSLLDDDHAFVRGNAIWVLAAVGEDADRDRLATVAEDDPAPTVREAAEAALAEL